MNRSVTLARVLTVTETADGHYLAWVDAKNLGKIRFESSMAPNFHAGDFVAILPSACSTDDWVTSSTSTRYALCTRGQFGLFGADEQQVFVVDAGMHLRPDPTFMIAAAGRSMDTTNCGMLVVPSYSGAILG